MKKWIGSLIAIFICVFWMQPVPVRAADTILNGIYADSVNLSGKTEDEAKSAIESYVAGICEAELTLKVAGDAEVSVKAGSLGFEWQNRELVQEALSCGKRGNLLARYKFAKDLQNSNKTYELLYRVDKEMIRELLENECSVFDREATEATLIHEGDSFSVDGGHVGYKLDVERSADLLEDYLINKWDHENATVSMVIYESTPVHKNEELSAIQDVLGECTTSYSTSAAGRCVNVENATGLINGTILYPGEEFSTVGMITPFSEENGYRMAGSYLNGKVVDSLGGGICQVSTTLYNAVLKSELEVTERHNHSMIVGYVAASADAAIAESAGKDFRFVNNTDYPIYIEGYTTKDKHVTFKVYGKETRPENRKVRYESEIIERTDPPYDLIYPEYGQGIGYIHVESAHVGYKAKLWKTVTVDGVVQSKELVNSSTYKMSPRSANVGVHTDDPAAFDAIMNACNSGSIDVVKATIASIRAAQ